MSWFARTLADSLSLIDDDTATTTISADSPSSSSLSPPHTASDSTSRGVKEDLSEITKTLTKKFWGVASFLAPPPPPRSSSPATDESDAGGSSIPGDDSSSTAIDGIRSDFAEIRGRFRSEISRFSHNKAVTEITKMASSLLSLGLEEEKASVDEYKARGVFGISEEVVEFVKGISMNPETWLDFPLPDSDECDEFDFSEIQQEHAMAVESLVPSLAALRIELCPVYMTEGCFWKIYFLLLHPKLTPYQASFKSPSQVLQDRGFSEKDAQPFSKKDPLPGHNFPEESSTDPTIPISPVSETITEKAPISSEDGPVKEKKYENEEEDGDEWLKEEDGSETKTEPGMGTTIIGGEEDVSFSDLEVEDDEPGFTGPVRDGAEHDGSGKEWVRLGDHVPVKSREYSASAGSEPTGWLHVKDIQ